MRRITLWAILLLWAVSAFGAPGNLDLVRVETNDRFELQVMMDRNIPVLHDQGTCLLLEVESGVWAKLESEGYKVTLLDRRSQDSEYFLVGLRPDSDLKALQEVGEVIHTEPNSNWVVLKAWPTWFHENLYEARVFATPLNRKPLIRSLNPEPFTISRPLGPANVVPLVQQMVNSVVNADIMSYWTSVVPPNPPGTGTRLSTSTGCTDAATYIYNTYTGLGLTAQSQSYRSGYAPNTIGTITGAVNPGKVYITISHLDDTSSTSYAPGADDNASGVVAGLEAAKIMSCYAFKNTVKFIACTGEEQGLYGSEAYAADAQARGENIQAVIAFDMPAWAGDGLPSTGENLDLNYNTGVPGSQALGQLFAACATDYGTGLPVDAFDCPSLTASDHYPFWQRGWAAVCGITDNEGYCSHAGNYPYYHTANDTIVNCGATAFFYSGVKATLATLAELGEPFKITLDKTSYGCSVPVTVIVGDKDLNTNITTVQTATIPIRSTRESAPEDLVLTEQGVNSMIFKGTINLSGVTPVHGDGLLSVNSGDTITADYTDAADCNGATNVAYSATGSVSTDCVPPVISNVQVTTLTDSTATITWTTDEAANSRVTYGLSTPPGTNLDDLATYVTSHSVTVTGLTACTKYYFSVTSADAVGNSATSDNGGTYYSFTTYGRSYLMGPDNVEGTVLSWVASGTAGAIWHQDTCKSNSPTHAWKAGAAQGTCPGTYANSATTDLTWNANITLGSAGHGYHLVWKEWYATESGYDWCLPQISVNGGGAWTDLATHYAGASGGWITKDIDLAAYTGSTVRIRFHFTSDGSASDEGWYVDDIHISKSQGCSADVKYQSHTRTDVCNGTGSGNNNGIWDPGEDSVITVTAVNGGMSAASNIVGTLTTSTPGITVTDSTATFPNMTANGGTGVSQPNHFSVRADSGITCGTVANFTLHTTCTENPAGSDSTFAMTVGQAGGTLTAFSEAFTGVTVPALPTGWTTLVTTGNAWVTNASGCTGNALMYPYNSSAAANSWAFSPAVTLTAGVTYTMAFNQKVYSASYPEAMEVKVGLGRTAATQTVLIYTATGLTNTACAARGGTFTVPTTGTYYFGFHCTSAADMWNLYVDDIAVTYTQAASCNVCTPTGCTAPGAPTLNSATGVCTGVNLAWTAGTGTTNSYNVYRFTGACGGAYTVLGGMPVTGLTYSDTTAVAGTSYAYVVRGACDAGGTIESVNSNCLTATRTAVPAAPTGVSATAGCTGNSIAWTNAPTATSHNVLRGTTCGTVVTTFTGVTTPYNDTSAVAGTTYNYWVVGINTCGTGANSSCATAARLAAPAAPAIPTFTAITDTALTVNWTAVSGAATYDVWRAAGGACAGAVKLTGTPIAGTTYPDSGLVCNTQYSYYITANNTCGTSANGTCGPVTTAACGAVPPEVGPGNTPATSQGWTNKTTATWPSEATATSYTLYRGMKADLLNLCSSTTDSCTKYAGAGTSTATITEDPTGIAGGFYWYLVTGTNGSGEGTPGAGQCNPRVVNSTGACP